MSTSGPRALLIPGDDAWRLGILSPTADAETWHVATGDADVIRAESVARILTEQGAMRPTVFVALPAMRCQAARLPIDEPAARRTGSRAWRRARLYELEEKLPIEAEAVVADFIAASDSTLGVCAMLDTLRALARTLEEASVELAGLSPLAMLVVEDVLATGRGHEASSAASPPAVIIGEGEGLNLITLEDGLPTAWHFLPPDADDVIHRLTLLRDRSGAKAETGAEAGAGAPTGPRVSVPCVGVDPELANSLTAGGWVTEAHGRTAESAALAAATRGVRREQRPLLDLRRDSLAPRDGLGAARRPAIFAAAALALLLLSLTASLLIGAARYDRVAADLRARQQTLYRIAIPEAREVPLDVVRRLQSHQRASALQAGSPDGLSQTPSALLTLHEVFRRLPDDGTFRLTRIRVDERGVELVGQTTSHALAGRLVEGLRHDGVFTAEQPQTTALREGGVGFTLRASRPAEHRGRP
jgi:hypothetical protein